MGNISDETLMAYADGELTGDERERIAQAIAKDATIRSRLNVFTQTREQLARAYDEPMQQPIPSHLMDLVVGKTGSAGLQSIPEVQPRRGRKVSIADFLQRWLPSGGSGFATAAALGLALMTGGVLGWQFRPPEPPAASHALQFVSLLDGRLVARGQFSNALTQLASGQQRSWSIASGKIALKPIFTFRTNSNRICRQYELSIPAGGRFSGVACRSSDGDWQIPVHVALSSEQQQPGNKAVPAAGAGGSLVDKLVDQLIDGDVLGAADETALMKHGWKPLP